MKRLQEAVKLAAKIREESYDKVRAEEASKSESGKAGLVEYSKFYTKTLEEAADEAAAAVGYGTRGTQPIFLLLQYAWNDILAWANT